MIWLEKYRMSQVLVHHDLHGMYVALAPWSKGYKEYQMGRNNASSPGGGWNGSFPYKFFTCFVSLKTLGCE